MRAQDLQELYGGLEFSTDLRSQSPIKKRDKADYEAPNTSYSREDNHANKSSFNGL